MQSEYFEDDLFFFLLDQSQRHHVLLSSFKRSRHSFVHDYSTPRITNTFARRFFFSSGVLRLLGTAHSTLTVCHSFRRFFSLSISVLRTVRYGLFRILTTCMRYPSTSRALFSVVLLHFTSGRQIVWSFFRRLFFEVRYRISALRE